MLFLLVPLLSNAQKVQLKGYVYDQSNEPLPLAHFLILPDSIIAPSDIDGGFSLTVAPGPKTIRVTYTGYKDFHKLLVLKRDTVISFSMVPKIGQLREVSIMGDPFSQGDLVQSNRSGTIILTKKDITNIPVLGGEADVIKTLQLLPGMVRGVEGSSDLFVRGGAADQNLVLLDGTTVYNSSHLFGFLSVFNPDVLYKVESINGGFPAEYGGRLSSIIDITTNKTLAEKTKVSGELGLIASRLYVEQPLLKDKLSMWVAGRRTYIDQVFKVIGEDVPYFFYDLNGKIIFKPGPSDQLEVGYYGGEDSFYLSKEEDARNYGFTSAFSVDNTSQFLKWNHWNLHGWNSHFTLTRTSFRYDIQNSFGENTLLAVSEIEDYGAKFSVEKSLGKKENLLSSGVEWTRHEVSPNVVNSSGIFSDYLESSLTSGKVAHEMAAFAQQDLSFGSRWFLGAGLRASFALVDQSSYFTPEPRFSLRYALRENQSLKLSYSRMAQYMHRISSSAISSPTDVWYPVTAGVLPQRSHQLSGAWQHFFSGKKVLISAEGYYKKMDNLIGYEEGTNLFFNPDFESHLIQGKGKAYGLELLLRKREGKFSGWLSYTLSWSWRHFDEINGGEWFLSRYDRRHNGAVVMQYALHERWSASMVWEFISGSRFTPVIGQYVVPSPSYSGVDLVPIYSHINGVKLADSHRLDLGIKFRSKPERNFGWRLFFGVNNVYNRASPVGLFVEKDQEDGSLHYSQPGLLGLLPFFSFGFDF